jgi:hypothetical protein
VLGSWNCGTCVARVGPLFTNIRAIPVSVLIRFFNDRESRHDLAVRICPDRLQSPGKAMQGEFSALKS